MNAIKIAKEFKQRRDRAPAKPDYQSLGVHRIIYARVKQAADAEGVPIVTMASAAIDQGLDAARAIIRQELQA